jgi:hypothetical protein
MGKGQGKRMRNDVDNDRLYLPAAIPFRFLHECAPKLRILVGLDRSALLLRHAEVAECRGDICVAFGYADFGRGQSQAGFESKDIAFESSGDLIWQFRKWKGSTKNKQKMAFRWPAAAFPPLLAALRDWFAVRKALGAVHTQIWRLPWEAKRLVASDFDKFLQLSLKRRAIEAPAGFAYSGHSCRAGSLSEASALGVPIVRLRFVGGYAVGSRVPEDKYIDPTCPPSPAGAFFFGWLQPPRSTFVDFSFGNVDSIINPSEPSASRREQPARQV